MSEAVRFISVKLTRVGRAQSFVLERTEERAVPRPGDPVVVQAEGVPALGTVVATIPQIADRLRPAGDSPNRVVRLATHEDVVARQRSRQREREAHRVALLKVQERGLAMKLTRVEQALDGSRMVFYFTADASVDCAVVSTTDTGSATATDDCSGVASITSSDAVVAGNCAGMFFSDSSSLRCRSCNSPGTQGHGPPPCDKKKVGMRFMDLRIARIAWPPDSSGNSF